MIRLTKIPNMRDAKGFLEIRFESSVKGGAGSIKCPVVTKEDNHLARSNLWHRMVGSPGCYRHCRCSDKMKEYTPGVIFCNHPRAEEIKPDD